MSSKDNIPTPSSNASVDDKIAFIRKLARLNRAAGREAEILPSSLFQDSPVGRGYDIFGAFADNESVQSQVLDYARLKQDGLVSSIPINDSDTLIVSGNTLSEVSSSMSASVSASGSGGLGAASFLGTSPPPS